MGEARVDAFEKALSETLAMYDAVIALDPKHHYGRPPEVRSIARSLAARLPDATDRERRLAEAANNARNALALTYTNVEGDRPHWCRFRAGHDATCAGMLATQDALRAALAAAGPQEPGAAK